MMKGILQAKDTNSGDESDHKWKTFYRSIEDGARGFNYLPNNENESPLSSPRSKRNTKVQLNSKISQDNSQLWTVINSKIDHQCDRIKKLREENLTLKQSQQQQQKDFSTLRANYETENRNLQSKLKQTETEKVHLINDTEEVILSLKQSKNHLQEEHNKLIERYRNEMARLEADLKLQAEDNLIFSNEADRASLSLKQFQSRQHKEYAALNLKYETEMEMFQAENNQLCSLNRDLKHSLQEREKQLDQQQEDFHRFHFQLEENNDHLKKQILESEKLLETEKKSFGIALEKEKKKIEDFHHQELEKFRLEKESEVTERKNQLTQLLESEKKTFSTVFMQERQKLEILHQQELENVRLEKEAEIKQKAAGNMKILETEKESFGAILVQEKENLELLHQQSVQILRFEKETALIESETRLTQFFKAEKENLEVLHQQELESLRLKNENEMKEKEARMNKSFEMVLQQEIEKLVIFHQEEMDSIQVNKNKEMEEKEAQLKKRYENDLEYLRLQKDMELKNNEAFKTFDIESSFKAKIESLELAFEQQRNENIGLTEEKERREQEVQMLTEKTVRDGKKMDTFYNENEKLSGKLKEYSVEGLQLEQNIFRLENIIVGFETKLNESAKEHALELKKQKAQMKEIQDSCNLKIQEMERNNLNGNSSSDVTSDQMAYLEQSIVQLENVIIDLEVKIKQAAKEHVLKSLEKDDALKEIQENCKYTLQNLKRDINEKLNDNSVVSSNQSAQIVYDSTQSENVTVNLETSLGESVKEHALHLKSKDVQMKEVEENYMKAIQEPEMRHRQNKNDNNDSSHLLSLFKQNVTRLENIIVDLEIKLEDTAKEHALQVKGTEVQMQVVQENCLKTIKEMEKDYKEKIRHISVTSDQKAHLEQTISHLEKFIIDLEKHTVEKTKDREQELNDLWELIVYQDSYIDNCENELDSMDTLINSKEAEIEITYADKARLEGLLLEKEDQLQSCLEKEHILYLHLKAFKDDYNTLQGQKEAKIESLQSEIKSFFKNQNAREDLSLIEDLALPLEKVKHLALTLLNEEKRETFQKSQRDETIKRLQAEVNREQQVLNDLQQQTMHLEQIFYQDYDQREEIIRHLSASLGDKTQKEKKLILTLNARERDIKIQKNRVEQLRMELSKKPVLAAENKGRENSNNINSNHNSALPKKNAHSFSIFEKSQKFEDFVNQEDVFKHQIQQLRLQQQAIEKRHRRKMIGTSFGEEL